MSNSVSPPAEPGVYPLLLTPEQKAGILQAAYKAEIYCTTASIEDWKKARKDLEAQNVQIYTWPPDQAQKLRDLAMPHVYQLSVEKPFGKEMLANVKKWVDDSRKSSDTWEKACQFAFEERSRAIK